MGRACAERLGYLPADLDKIHAESLESFASVGHYFHFADLREDEHIIDFGSRAGIDTFISALKTGQSGRVVDIDMKYEQRVKAMSFKEKAVFSS